MLSKYFRTSQQLFSNQWEFMCKEEPTHHTWRQFYWIFFFFCDKIVDTIMRDLNKNCFYDIWYSLIHKFGANFIDGKKYIY